MFKHTLLKHSLAAGLAIGAASFPTAAQARYIEDPPSLPVASQPVVSTPAVSKPISRAQSAFHWADAGIGAAGTVLLLGAGAGATSAMRRRRVHRAVSG